MFRYCSGGERSLKCVRPAMEIDTSKEVQRGVVHFMVAEGAATRHKVKTPEMLSNGIIFCIIIPIPILPIW